MTESEAKKYILLEKECINRDCNRDCANCDVDCFIVQDVEDLNNTYDVAINALEKQIPNKPIFDFNSNDTLSRFHCACGKIIWVHHDIGTMDNNDAPNYCSNCSIKLDWNE